MKDTNAANVLTTKARRRKWLYSLNKYKWILLMVLPAMIVIFIFVYIPIGGNVLAFKDYSIRRGIWGSDWVGMEHFIRLWNRPAFWRVFQNQIEISLMNLALGFPTPIILALLLNEMRHIKLKRVFQTAYTFPHFISWIVVAGIIVGFLADQGIVNQVILFFGGDRNQILHDGGQFRILLYVSQLWKTVGWSSILYLAALASINPELYEAAAIDGAGRWKQMIYITLPSILPLASLLLVLSAGSILSGGFDQIINLYNPMVMERSDIIATYIFRTAIVGGMNLSYATAVGVFQAVVNLIILIVVNITVRFMGQEGVL